MKLRLLFVLLIAIVAMGFGLKAAQEQATPVQIINRSMQSVVALYMDGYDGCVGTGFYIGDGKIVTAGHLTEIDIAYVKFEDGTTCEVLNQYVHEDYDCGFIFVEPVDKPALRFDADGVVRGEITYMVGNPTGNTFIATTGIVSGWVEVEGWFGDIVMILTDAAAHRGNSGSPLIDEDGEVIGLYVGTSRLTNCNDFPNGCAVNVQVSDILAALEVAMEE